MIRSVILFTILVCNFGCQDSSPSESLMAQWESEVVQAETDFAAMAKAEGLEAAFIAFAAEDAVLQRNNTVFKGPEAFRAYFAASRYPDADLSWTPEFVDVAQAGDMAYTYGPFTFSAQDTSGEMVNAEGIFHTVWKRQEDGSWKYVWD